MTQESIGRAAVNALILEVSVTPKPGLVDRVSSGAHTDMDCALFMKSAYSLENYFASAAGIGFYHRKIAGKVPGSIDYGAVFADLRREGIKAEHTMNAATGGVNTHRGAVFTLGILCAAAVIAADDGGNVSAKELFAAAGRIAAFSLDDFAAPDGHTFGLELYRQTGSRGIRGEAADGYPSVSGYGLPVFSAALSSGLTLNDSSLLALLILVCVSDDTVLLKRCGGTDAAGNEKKKVRDLLSGNIGALTEKTVRLDTDWSARGISAGGSADLLSAVLFVSAVTGVIPAGADAFFRVTDRIPAPDSSVLDLLPDKARQFLVLASREDRWARRRVLASLGYTVLCATAAVPHTVRYGRRVSDFVRDELNVFLTESGRTPAFSEFLNTSDGPVFIAAFGGADALSLKKKAAAFEDSLPARRLLDIDIMSPDGKTVSGADIGRGARPCIVCGGSAKICMRAHAHTDVETVRAIIDLLDGQEALK